MLEIVEILLNIGNEFNTQKGMKDIDESINIANCLRDSCH
jgi:hypothetical protein